MKIQKNRLIIFGIKSMVVCNKAYALCLTIILVAIIPVFAAQPDTLRINQITETPQIDGFANESIWQQAQWISINQVWMPWKDKIKGCDFSGRYKVLWSEKTNLLYFVAEITDDVFRDGYVYSQKNPNYANYDIFEIFIDADNSGGLHVFDGACADANKSRCWGVNAENAFSYHINVNVLDDGVVTHLKSVEDLSGKGWRRKNIENYSNHLPDFAFCKSVNVYTYEFSLKVYKDTYNPQNPSEDDRDKLQAGKIMGLSTAYSDADNSLAPPKRESFIGSTPGNENALDSNGDFNQTWMNSSYYQIVQLVGLSNNSK